MKRNASCHRLTECNLLQLCGLGRNLKEHMHNQRHWTATIFVCGCMLLVPSVVLAASGRETPGAPATPAATLPDAPVPPAPQTGASSSTPSSAPAASQSDEGKQTKRILGIVPNFRAVSANQKL